MDRFYNRNSFKSGAGAISYWHCLDKACTSKVRARYQDHSRVNEDVPEVEGRPTSHLIKITNIVHPPKVGKRLKEMAQTKIKQSFKNNPLRAVAETHEEVVNKMLETLIYRTDREEFIRAMPSTRNSARKKLQKKPGKTSSHKHLQMKERSESTASQFSLGVHHLHPYQALHPL